MNPEGGALPGRPTHIDESQKERKQPMNRRNFQRKQLTALAALLSLAGLAQADQQATFFVPIHLTNLPPEVTSVSACCVVPKMSSGTAKSGATPAEYSCSQQQLTVSNGAANGELAVSAPIQANSAYGNGKYQYECQARLTANINGTRVFLWPANGNAPPTRSGAFFVRGNGSLGKTN